MAEKTLIQILHRISETGTSIENIQKQLDSGTLSYGLQNSYMKQKTQLVARLNSMKKNLNTLVDRGIITGVIYEYEGEKYYRAFTNMSEEDIRLFFKLSIYWGQGSEAKILEIKETRTSDTLKKL